jgi:signal transduction histidine kinase
MNINEELERLKKENAELKKTLERKNELIDHLPATVSWINKDLKYVEINKNLSELIGIDLKTFEEQDVGFLKADNSKFYKFISEFFKSNKKTAEIEYATDVNGEVKHHSIIADKYHGDEEAVIIGLDITKRVQLEEQVKSDERLRIIGELTTGIIHEIKNPLTVIQLNAQLLRDFKNTPDLEKLHKHGEKIVKMSKRISAIIDGLKNLGRDTSNDQLEPTQLSHLLNESLLIVKPKALKYGVQLDIQNKLDENFELSCIEGQIIQILVNLIGNACEAVAELDDKWVKLIVDKTDKCVMFRIIDSGKGIEDKVIEKMFDAFFTTKPKGIGTGMGLGICREIAQNHAGMLEYDSVEGHTSFLLKLPAI